MLARKAKLYYSINLWAAKSLFAEKINKHKRAFYDVACRRNFFSRRRWCALFWQRLVVLLWLHNLCWYGCCLNKQPPQAQYRSEGASWWNCDYVLCSIHSSWRTHEHWAVMCFCLFQHHQRFTSFRSLFASFFAWKCFFLFCVGIFWERKNNSLNLKNLTHMEACGGIILTRRRRQM